MSKFKIIFIIFLLIFSLFVWFLTSLFFHFSKIDYYFSISENIFPDFEKLNKNKIILQTKQNPKNFKISWDCGVFWKLSQSDWYTHIFDIQILQKDCNLEKVNVFLKNNFLELKKTFNLVKNYNLYEKYLDFSDKDLQNFLEISKKSISSIDLSIIENSELKVKKFREKQELEYIKNFIENILEKRKEKYIIPVEWGSLPTREVKLPNSLRPYRADYTDWVHQWWDFDAKKYTPVLALDNWIIIRIVSWYKFEDTQKVDKSENLTYEQKTLNLDILRGNQVWLKTMKWDVAFYSHLSEIWENLKVWEIVKKWQILWKVGASWVPEIWYSDFHLHLQLHKNPYIFEKSWKYSFLEIMLWDWYFKGKNLNYILENQKNIFQE